MDQTLEFDVRIENGVPPGTGITTVTVVPRAPRPAPPVDAQQHDAEQHNNGMQNEMQREPMPEVTLGSWRWVPAAADVPAAANERADGINFRQVAVHRYLFHGVGAVPGTVPAQVPAAHASGGPPRPPGPPPGPAPARLSDLGLPSSAAVQVINRGAAADERELAQDVLTRKSPTAAQVMRYYKPTPALQALISAARDRGSSVGPPPSPLPAVALRPAAAGAGPSRVPNSQPWAPMWNPRSRPLHEYMARCAPGESHFRPTPPLVQQAQVAGPPPQPPAGQQGVAGVDAMDASSSTDSNSYEMRD